MFHTIYANGETTTLKMPKSQYIGLHHLHGDKLDEWLEELYGELSGEKHICLDAHHGDHLTFKVGEDRGDFFAVEQTVESPLPAGQSPAPNTLKKMHDKYRDLVWYAHALSSDDGFSEESQWGIETQYPVEAAALNCEHGCDWNHGFNSGVLAALRLVLDVRGFDGAKEDFPELDV